VQVIGEFGQQTSRPPRDNHPAIICIAILLPGYKSRGKLSAFCPEGIIHLLCRIYKSKSLENGFEGIGGKWGRLEMRKYDTYISGSRDAPRGRCCEGHGGQAGLEHAQQWRNALH
jgi:hypothetical protein